MNKEKVLFDRVRALEGLVGMVNIALTANIPIEAKLTIISLSIGIVATVIPTAISSEEDLKNLTAYFTNTGKELQERIMFSSQFGDIEQERANKMFQEVAEQFSGMLNVLESFDEFETRYETLKDKLTMFVKEGK